MNDKGALPKTPETYFGAGKISQLPELIQRFGRRVLLVTGGASFSNSAHYTQLMTALEHFDVEQHHVTHEPSPDDVDSVARHSHADVVVAIGGGSVLDAGKAIAAMIPVAQPVEHYLEGVGHLTHPGTRRGFIAVPTTAGTGSEATNNAVISKVGPGGFKRSLRHDNFLPDIALIDPVLTVSCPLSVTATSGMDAFTQLLESYLSDGGNNVTDAMALEGLACIRDGLFRAYRNGEDLEARTNMSLAAYLSGIALATAGLGLVHGFASSIGGLFAIPHGVICSRLMGPCNMYTVRRLREIDSSGDALIKYAKVGRLFSKDGSHPDHYYVDALVDLIYQYTDVMQIADLGNYGVAQSDVAGIAAVTDNKRNPVPLNNEDKQAILLESL